MSFESVCKPMGTNTAARICFFVARKPSPDFVKVGQKPRKSEIIVNKWERVSSLLGLFSRLGHGGLRCRFSCSGTGRVPLGMSATTFAVTPLDLHMQIFSCFTLATN